ncbi:hypothetical protein BT69DRAFT_78618 [Atractiella rhizophila]|nr:hypothetical protein BT69DRAFT_78618 [Atractiella rhizophila]
MAPLESLAGSAGRCITSQRALYGSLCAWIVLTILSLGGTAFFLMYKKIRVQAKLHRRLDQDLQAITARQNVPMTLSGNKEKVRHMELATQDLHNFSTRNQWTNKRRLVRCPQLVGVVDISNLRFPSNHWRHPNRLSGAGQSTVLPPRGTERHGGQPKWWT